MLGDVYIMAKTIAPQYRVYDDHITLKEFKIQYALGALHWHKRYHMAGDSTTPIEILAILAKDPNDLVRRRARHSPCWKGHNFSWRRSRLNDG